MADAESWHALIKKHIPGQQLIITKHSRQLIITRSGRGCIYLYVSVCCRALCVCARVLRAVFVEVDSAHFGIALLNHSDLSGSLILKLLLRFISQGSEGPTVQAESKSIDGGCMLCDLMQAACRVFVFDVAESVSPGTTQHFISRSGILSLSLNLQRTRRKCAEWRESCESLIQ